MKMMAGILFFSLIMNSCFAGCFDRPQPVVVVNQSQQQYVLQPVVVQQTRMVPVVETRLEYRPVASYYLNYSYYYPQLQYVPQYQYGYRYVIDPWQGYNY